MNANIHFFQATIPNSRATAKAIDASRSAAPIRTSHLHRERDFGIGYGNSSGYASARRYVDNRTQPRFRCI